MKKKLHPEIERITKLRNKPVMTKSAREDLAKRKPAPKRQPKEDFNQAAFRAVQETAKRSES